MIACRGVRFKDGIGLPQWYMEEVVRFLRTRNPDPDRHIFVSGGRH